MARPSLRSLAARVAFGASVAFGPFEALARLPRFRPVAIEAFARFPWLALVIAVIVGEALLVAAVHLLVLAMLKTRLVIRRAVFSILVGAVAAGTTLFLEASAAFAEHAVIMIGILQVIFGLYAVAAKLRVARHALVFLKKLGGVAALAIVLTVAVGPSTEVLGPLAATAAAAATLSIIDQMRFPSKAEASPLFTSGGQSRAPINRGAALTLSFRSAPNARSERPIASGVETGCAQLCW
jgi:hypothetical protein